MQIQWRRERDSNPRYGYKPYTRFPGVRLQPLGHLSAEINFELLQSTCAARPTAGYTLWFRPLRLTFKVGTLKVSLHLNRSSAFASRPLPRKVDQACAFNRSAISPLNQLRSTSVQLFYKRGYCLIRALVSATALCRPCAETTSHRPFGLIQADKRARSINHASCPVKTQSPCRLVNVPRSATAPGSQDSPAWTHPA